MNPFRHSVAAYRAIVGPDGWELQAECKPISLHRTFSDAARAASKHDWVRRRLRVALTHTAAVLGCLLFLVPVVLGREVPNPDYPPAREFADRMEAAYRAVDGGAPIGDVAGGAISGAVIAVDRGGVESDYNVLTGSHVDDCYVLRWVRFEVPFVARLLPRFECEPGPPAVNFSASAFEAIAVNISTSGPLNWDGVIPDEIDLAPWFFPLAIVLSAVAFHQLVGLSLLYLRRPRLVSVDVERVDGA